MTAARKWLIAGSVLFMGGGLALIVVFIVALAQVQYRSLPTDASLIDRFQRHRSDLDTIVATALPDTQLVGAGVGILSFGSAIYVHGESGFNRMLGPAEAARTGRNRYFELLRSAGLSDFSRSSPQMVWFTVATNGSAAKGLVYSRKPFTNLRASLDGYDKDPGFATSWPFYRPLAPGWYLFLTLRD